ncbi:MAG: FliM/FliN family flagellar motor switch protein [Verrucomicrobia bacterium]|nr:FliM/FliN family flagellar motor switch protein [Verrucomicrobiota bacterium]
MAEDPQKPQVDTLDQSEIDRLIAQSLEPQEAKKTVLGGGSKHATPPKVEQYDFRNPVFLSEGELRRLRLLHEDFIRYLSARLSLFLRMEFGLKMSGLTTVTYSKFCESLPSPTHLSLFKVEPLVGVGILDINPRLALTVADRLLGGRGHSVKAERYLTEIEIALIEDVILAFLEEWCAQWKSDQEMHPSVIGHENNGRFLQTSPKDAIVLALTLEASFGDCSEQIQIGVPYYTIEPMVKKMQAKRQKDSAVAPSVRRSEWHAAYDRITLPVRAEWQAVELPVREIASLRVGDVIELPASICQETRVLLSGTAKFIGTVGLDTDRVAIQITRKLPAEDANQVKPDGRKSP